MARNITIDPTLGSDTAGVSYRQLQTALDYASGQSAATINGWGGINFNCYPGNIGPGAVHGWASGIAQTCTIQPAIPAAWQDGTANLTQGAYISSTTGTSWASNSGLLVIAQSHFVVKGLRVNYETASNAYEVGIYALSRATSAAGVNDDIWIIGNYIDYNPGGTTYHPMAIRAMFDAEYNLNLTASMTVNVIGNVIQGHNAVLANKNTYGILGSCYVGYYDVPWQANTAYSLNTSRSPLTPNGYRYVVTTAGTSGSTQPTWPTTLGQTVTDGGVTWTCTALWAQNATLNFNVYHNTIVRHNADTAPDDQGAAIRAQSETISAGGNNAATINAVWRNNLSLVSTTGASDKCYVTSTSSPSGPGVVNVMGSNNIDNDGSAAALGMASCITTTEVAVRNAANDLRLAPGSRGIRGGTATGVDGVLVDCLGRPFKGTTDIGAFFFPKPAGYLSLMGVG